MFSYGYYEVQDHTCGPHDISFGQHCSAFTCTFTTLKPIYRVIKIAELVLIQEQRIKKGQQSLKNNKSHHTEHIYNWLSKEK